MKNPIPNPRWRSHPVRRLSVLFTRSVAFAARAFPRGGAAAVLALLVGSVAHAAQLLPGVYGYGLDRSINAAGFGSDSTILEVTNLNDSGAGSLRDAVERTGRRIVVFRTSGAIDLQSRLRIDPGEGNITIAGQTAPSPGISINNAIFHVQASNVLVQHVRIRPGDRWEGSPQTTRDALSISHSSDILTNIVFDHCTFAWSVDEMIQVYNDWDNVTFNKCIFAEPLKQSIHMDENTMDPNVPLQAETVTPLKSPTSRTTSNLASSEAVNGNYQRFNATADDDWVEYTLPLVSSSSARPRRVAIVGIKGPDRGKFRIEVRRANGSLLNFSPTVPNEIVDQYAASAAQHTYVSHQNQVNSSRFTIPAGDTALKVRLIVVGKHASSSGRTLGIDQISITDNHGMGPYTSSGTALAGDDGGKLTIIGSIFAHCQERSPLINARQFYFANNIVYNRENKALSLGQANNWNHPMEGAIIGNTFIEGRSWNGSHSPIVNHDFRTGYGLPTGSQIYAPTGNNAHDYGDDPSPPSMVNLGGFTTGSDPTDKTHGLNGVTALTPANAVTAALADAGARPADRDSHELRIISEITEAPTINALGSRPGAIKNFVAAGDWPSYDEYTTSHIYPSNPHSPAPSPNQAYTNIELWLHQKAADVESGGGGGGGGTPELVAHWALDEGSGTTTADSSGKGNTGSLSPAPAWTSGLIGSNALDFDGDDDKVNVGNGSSLANLVAQGGGGMTIAAWIRADSMGESGTGRILNKSTSTSAVAGWQFHLYGDNQLFLGVDFASTKLNRASAVDAISTGAWRHVAVTWTGSASASSILMYVDGSPVSGYASGQDGVGGRVDDASTVVYIGNDSSGARAFEGLLDDVRVYNYVLTPAAIATLAVPPGPPAPSGLGATAVSHQQINLVWTDNASNETGFKIERKKGSDGTYAQIAAPAANVVTHNDTTCGTGTQYYYRVLAYNASGESAFAPEANATTDEVADRRGHWKFDSNATDSSGLGNNGALSGSPTYTTGKISSGLEFFGDDELVDCGNGSSLANLPALTIAAWIKPDNLGENSQGRIVYKSTGTTVTAGWQFLVSTDNRLQFAVDYATNLSRYSANGVVTADGATWQHVVVTWTGSATATNIKFYKNGAETGYGTTVNGTSLRVDDASTNLYIGNDHQGVRTFDGVIDDVRIYNRVLTTAEITAIYNAGL